MTVLLEIIKTTVPALIVFLTVYYLMKQYFENQHKLKLLEMKQGNQKESIPLRLQAYERLSLYCERISLPNLILRIRKDGMSSKELQVALMMAIQYEYEHNVTQQVYVSEQLWQILKIARDDAVNTISIASEMVDPKAEGKELAKTIFGILEKRDSTGLDKALKAVKAEAGLLL